MYQLARAYETTGQPEKALATLNEVVRRYPASPRIAEVQFRRGELLFSARRYREAETAYAEVDQVQARASTTSRASTSRAGRCSSRTSTRKACRCSRQLLDVTAARCRARHAASASRSRLAAPTASWWRTRCA